MNDASDVLALADRWRIAPPSSRRQGHAGKNLGKATGASLEFEDRRAYAPGDDLRHLDWATYARTDELMVRRYRDEIQPRVEIVLDASASMASDWDKARLARRLARLCGECGMRDHSSTRVIVAGDRPAALEPRAIDDASPAFDGKLALPEAIRSAASLLRASSHVIVVSDGLFPAEPKALIGPLARRAGSFAWIQVLSEFDAAPDRGGAYQLEDAESGATVDVVLDAAAVERYRGRLERHGAGLAMESQRSGGTFASVVATKNSDLAEICREILLPNGVLAPR